MKKLFGALVVLLLFVTPSTALARGGGHGVDMVDMLHMEAVALLTILVKAPHITQVRAQAKVQTNQIPIAIQINQAVLQNQVLNQNSLMQSMTQM